MDRRTLLKLSTFAIPLFAERAIAELRLVVVVNPNNPTDSLSKGELAAIFTTKRRHWSGDEKIFPFNAPPRDATRVAFDREVLGMGPDEVARYWINRRIRGGHRPPRQLSSHTLVLKVVSKVEGAISYLPESMVDRSVKAVATIAAREG